ncbi:gentisate 1,2-dioxygenase [Halomonas sp. 25-S5]|uniref:gentisate 1,2-dioxygenase n=1 Tax=Halomonas sp. 25-S5 TaxID=2994065 RepID=UPI002468FBC1|nr:gentisate 1,2-dioxygenase [Halomonas sp. 25-S5]
MSRPDLNMYYKKLENQHLGPLWEVLKGLVPNEPKPRAQPHHWDFAAVRERIIEAGTLISAEEAERRVLVLQNPGLPETSQITDTLYAGLQLILPGEVAPAHRHTQSALRFIIEGSGAYTSVDGERTTMHPGDFIITPSWAWHDHGNEADEPVIWLDGLDVPLVNFLRAGFREEHENAVHKTVRPEGDAMARYGMGLVPITLNRGGLDTSPVFNYPYERTREALEHLRHDEPDPHHGHCLRYVNPTNGDWAIPTIATSMRLLPKGFHTRPYASTDGAVMVVVEGRVKVKIGSEEFLARPKDVLALPGWLPYELEAVEDTVAFTYSDRPVYEKLGLWREWLG